MEVDVDEVSDALISLDEENLKFLDEGAGESYFLLFFSQPFILVLDLTTMMNLFAIFNAKPKLVPRPKHGQKEQEIEFEDLEPR